MKTNDVLAWAMGRNLEIVLVAVSLVLWLAVSFTGRRGKGKRDLR